MGNIAALAVYALVLMGGTFFISKDQRHRFIAFILLSVTVILALLMSLGWLPAPSTGWMFPAALQFSIWLALGVLTGVVIVLARTRRFFIALLSMMIVVVLLFTLGWSLEFGNPNVGWGLFVAPSLVAGIIYVLSSLVVITAVALPHYLMGNGRSRTRSGLCGTRCN
ncbi:MAG: hypothetical protein C4294_19595 [Nitrospiraceae bacterium]